MGRQQSLLDWPEGGEGSHLRRRSHSRCVYSLPSSPRAYLDAPSRWRRLTIVGGVREALLGWRLGRWEIVRPRRHWPALLRGPSTSPLEVTSGRLGVAKSFGAARCERYLTRSSRRRLRSAHPSARAATGCAEFRRPRCETEASLATVSL